MARKFFPTKYRYGKSKVGTSLVKNIAFRIGKSEHPPFLPSGYLTVRHGKIHHQITINHH